jgi:hypothetical protein
MSLPMNPPDSTSLYREAQRCNPWWLHGLGVADSHAC